MEVEFQFVVLKILAKRFCDATRSELLYYNFSLCSLHFSITNIRLTDLSMINGLERGRRCKIITDHSVPSNKLAFMFKG